MVFLSKTHQWFYFAGRQGGKGCRHSANVVSFACSDIADILIRLAPTITQRLVLNLRALDDKVNGPGTVMSQPLPPIDFAHGSVIGNIGAPLCVDGNEGEHSYDEDDIHEVARDLKTTATMNDKECPKL